MRLTRLALLGAVALLWCSSAPAAAPHVRMDVRDGMMSLEAQEAELRTILQVWARIGGATIVNAEKITGGPLTLELKDTPEWQALGILLRGASGYVLSARESGSSGASLYERLEVVPAEPGNAPQARTNQGTRPVLESVPPSPPERGEGSKDVLHSVPPSPTEPGEEPKDVLHSVPPSLPDRPGAKEALSSVPASPGGPEHSREHLRVVPAQ